jgi:putative flippase GtrA
MGSQLQLRAAGEPWRRTLGRAVGLLRADRILAQGVRFAITGALVSVIYISVTTVLAEVSHLRFQVALVIGWCAAISVHFTLQRVFVWTHQEEFALPFGHQIGRYLLLAGTQLGVTALTTAVLPSALGLPTEVIYLATAALLTLINFLLFRNRIFHASVSDTGRA